MNKKLTYAQAGYAYDLIRTMSGRSHTFTNKRTDTRSFKWDSLKAQVADAIAEKAKKAGIKGIVCRDVPAYQTINTTPLKVILLVGAPLDFMPTPLARSAEVKTVPPQKSEPASASASTFAPGKITKKQLYKLKVGTMLEVGWKDGPPSIGIVIASIDRDVGEVDVRCLFPKKGQVRYIVHTQILSVLGPVAIPECAQDPSFRLTEEV